MSRPPPIFTLTDTLFPYPTRFRSREEKLLAVLARRGDVGCSAGFLFEAGILEAQATGLTVADVAGAAAAGAGAFRVVALPPATRPAGPVVAGVDAPGQAALAGSDVLGAAGMATERKSKRLNSSP